MTRPTNWATEARDALITKAGRGQLPPDIPEDLLTWLEMVYPPACYSPGSETLEHHLMQAGRVDLIKSLRAYFTHQREAESELLAPDPDLEE